MVQIVHGEPVADVALGGLGIGPDLPDGAALPLLLGAEVQQKPLAQGRAQGVHHEDLGLRKFRAEVSGGDGGGLVGGGQGGGEVDAQNILPLGQNGPHGVLKLPHADSGGGGGLTGADAGVKILKADLPAVQPVAVIFSVRHNLKRQHLKAKLIRQFLRQVAGRVSHYHIFFTHIASFLPVRFFINGNIIP